MYGETEIVNFAQGMAQHTGVDIRVRQGEPATDGKTVWLDCTPCKDQTEYLVRTGDADHEIAHAWFGTVPALKGRAAEIAKSFGKPELEWLAHECLNVVVDIHDETRMEKLIPGVAEALRIGNLMAGKRIYDSYSQKGGTNWRDHLMIGIVASRCGSARGSRKGIKWLKDFTHRHVKHLKVYPKVNGLDVSRVYAICDSCREKSPPKQASRDKRAWNSIISKGYELFGMLKDLVKPEDKMPDNTKPGDGSAGAPVGQTDQQQNDANKRVRENIATCIKNGTSPGYGSDPFANPGDPTQGSGGGAAQPSQRQTNYIAKPKAGFYQQCMATMGRAMSVIMETSDSMRLTHYRDSGQALGKKWVNLFTNGRVFKIKDQADGHELSMAILLDRSGSMDRIVGDCAAACAAIGNTARGFGAQVRAWLFGDTSKEVDVASMENGVESEGRTAGCRALREATQWLQRQPSGRRLCAVVTDGQWSDGKSARGVLLDGANNGVEYVFIGLGMDRRVLLNQWPLGVKGIGCAADAHQLANQLLEVVGSGIK